MLRAVGVGSLDDLVRVPEAVALRAPIELPPALPEAELLDHMAALAQRNTAHEYISFLGAGAYRHYVPPVVTALAMRGEFLTSYTPYQAEVSQGYLQAIYEWQTYIALLTGLDVANASVYDGATALAEAVIMAVNATGRHKVLVSRAVHPNYRAVLRTYAEGLELEIDELDFEADGRTSFETLDRRLASREYAAIALQTPNFFGVIDPLPAGPLAAARASGTLVIAVTAEALALAALATPASWGADIAAGEAQSFGVSLAYGGPYVGFIATTDAHLRRIPGRLVGKTLDNRGREAYVLTLQAREQHIRRERATSNICTNQAHCALLATIYLAALGKRGLEACVSLNLRRTHALIKRVRALGGGERRFEGPFFNEIAVRVPGRAREALAFLQSRNILGGVDLGRWYPELADCVLMAATELTTPAQIETAAAALAEFARLNVGARVAAG
jgi:glycine dehydrogenase subunit 1